MGFAACCRHSGSSWNASRVMYDSAQRSVTVSSSCGRNTLTRKSSRNDVSVLIAISESWGTMSFSLCRKEREGGSMIAMLKTLGSVSSLCVAGPAFDTRSVFGRFTERLCGLDTRPGTDVCNISSRSSCSFARLLAFWSSSARLKTRYAKVSKGRKSSAFRFYLESVSTVAPNQVGVAGSQKTGFS